ncbi:MAG: hypothetical protein AAB209_12725 [Bacteroidota bacterium]
MEPTIQYLTDKAGKRTAVFMSVSEWEAFYKRHKRLENKLRFYKEFAEATQEVKLMIQGKKKGKRLSERLTLQ